MKSEGRGAHRIVIVIGSIGPGGAERVVVDLARYLHDAGREVIILTLNGDEEDFYSLPEGVSRARIDIRRRSPSAFHLLWNAARQLLIIRRQIIALQPSIVVSFLDQTNVRVVAALFGRKIPVVISERVHPAHNNLPRLWEVARRILYPHASALVVQTASSADWFRKHTSVRRIVVIPNAVRFKDEFRPKPHQTEMRWILNVGRLTRQKGHDLLLRAFRESRLGDHGWQLVIVGDGPDRLNLMELAASLGVAHRVTFSGHAKDVASFITRAQVFVLSSRFEGFPNALLEAMQLGCACISFDCPSGPGELITSDVNGILVPPEDVSGMTEALKRLAGDSALRRRLGVEAAKVGVKFSHREVFERWLGTIEGAVSGDKTLLGSLVVTSAGQGPRGA